MATPKSAITRVFLSTLSAWRATIKADSYKKAHSISIHALRMESDKNIFYVIWSNIISIHALRMESDF